MGQGRVKKARTEQAETPAEVAPASDRERRALKYHCERREVREAKIAYLFDESVGTDQIRRFFELLEQDENVHDTEYTVTFRTDDGVRTQAFRRVSDIDEHYWTDGKTNGFSVNVTSHNSRPSILIYSFLKNFLVVEAMLAPRIIEVVDACMERPLGS